MFFFTIDNKFLKSKKIILPGIRIKDLKPVSHLLSPVNLIIPMLVICILGQIVDDLKSILNSRDIQQISSVRLYLKLLSSGKSAVTLSVVNSISKTLGPELETLSILNARERLKFLHALKKKIIFEKSAARITAKPHILSDHVELMKHRKGLALQCRSLLVAAPIFSPHLLVSGIQISQVTLDFVINSCKSYWMLLGLSGNEFEFLLKKEALNCFNKLSLNKFFEEPNDFHLSIVILLYAELKELTNCDGNLNFLDDGIILSTLNNLTLIEAELKFLNRNIPHFPESIVIPDSNLNDIIIRTAVDQRKVQNLKLNNIFKHIDKNNLSTRSTINILKNINIKRTLWGND